MAAGATAEEADRATRLGRRFPQYRTRAGVASLDDEQAAFDGGLAAGVNFFDTAALVQRRWIGEPAG